MQRAADLFNADDRRQISQAVGEAEARTSAEIVPVVAASSGRYDRPEDIVGLWIGLLLLAIVWLVLPEQSTAEPGSWGSVPAGLHLLALVLAVLVGFVLGAFIGARVGWLRRLFTPARQMRQEVLARAQQVFYLNRVHRTTGATGLLIYVALFERMAAVIADQTVLEKLGQGTLNELCVSLTADLRSTSPTQALCTTIRVAGDRLASVLPRAEGDVNELSDALVVLDGP